MQNADFENAGTLRASIHSRTRQKRSDDADAVRTAVSSFGRLPLRAEPTWNDSGLSATDLPHGDIRPVSRRRRGTSRGGGADGDPLREARGRGDLERPNFNVSVPSNGYAWWYIDGISDGADRAISIIGFIGSVFSPWYRWSGRKNPENHVCINVATYGPGGRFTMTDRGQSALRQSQDVFQVGPSSMTWDKDRLIIDVNEIGSPPLISRVKGRIIVTPSAMTHVELALSTDGAHVWRPFAPTSHISVDLNGKGWQWEGHGYFDSNFGTRALEDDFKYWTWGRYPMKGGSACFYDLDRLDGSTLATAVHFDHDGAAKRIDLPPKARIKRSLWAVARETRADAGYQPKQVKAMLDAPFYCRSAVKTKLDGEETVGVHEALDLVRFRSPFIKPMLAVRVPRRSAWRFD